MSAPSLTPGDEVVTNGAFTVDAAAQLQGKKSMMNKTKSSKAYAEPIGEAKTNMDFNMAFKNSFFQGLWAYMELKDALVTSEGKNASSAAKIMAEELSKLEVQMFDDLTRFPIKRIMENLMIISEVSDIEKQRKAFKPLSENMVYMASHLNDFEAPIYVQFCPMADNKNGGSWLSLQNEILNPYYGEKMLNCGSVTKIIQ